MLDIIIVCTIIAAAMVLFVSEKIRIDLVALSIMAVLMVVGALQSRCGAANTTNRVCFWRILWLRV